VKWRLLSRLYRWQARRANVDALIWNNKGVFRSGRYSVPAIEDTAGQTSATKALLDRDPREIRRLVDDTFASIGAAGGPDTAANAVNLMKEQNRRFAVGS